MKEDNSDFKLMDRYRSSNDQSEIQMERDEEQNVKLMAKTEPISPMQDINKAFENCKFGRFHMRLLFTTFTGIIASILVNNSVSYLLPIAECDLDMNLKEKGQLNAIPYTGMFFSSVISGFLIDTFGRIFFLKVGYGGLFLFTLLSSMSQNYVWYAVAKFGEGLLSVIALNGVMPLTSEFCHPSIRDRVMLCQSSFSALAQIIIPAMAWGILIQNWELSLFDGAFVLKTWNFYLIAVSIWSLTAYLLYLTLPESPKFLVTQKKYYEARNILIQVYTENTGKSADSFPYLNLWEQEIKDEANTKISQKDGFKDIWAQIIVGLRNMKPLLQRPLITSLAIMSAMQTIIMGLYNVLRLWFPQLSTIVEHYNFDGDQNFCDLMDNYTAGEKLKIINSTIATTKVCVPHVSGTETYVNSIIIGLVCIVPYFISGVIINKVGKKCLLIICTVICIGALLGIRWANSKTMLVSLFSIDVAVTQTMKSLNQVVMVEVFPTAMRSLAMSLMMSFARVGTLICQIGFPILLSMACEIPFYTMSGILVGLIVLSIFMPKKKES